MNNRNYQMKSHHEMKSLHGKDYLKSYERVQSIERLGKLLGFMALEKDDDVVDFACGNGLLMQVVAPQVHSYTGVDFSQPFVEAGNLKKNLLHIDNAEFVCDDIGHFCKIRPKYFDVGFAMDFSEHVYDDEWHELLVSMKSSIKPGGLFYLHTPNADFFLEKMKARNFMIKQYPQHIAVRNPSENVALVEAAGFRVTQVRLIPHYNIFRYMHWLSFLPLIGKFCNARIFIEATPT